MKPTSILVLGNIFGILILFILAIIFIVSDDSYKEELSNISGEELSEASGLIKGTIGVSNSSSGENMALTSLPMAPTASLVQGTSASLTPSSGLVNLEDQDNNLTLDEENNDIDNNNNTEENFAAEENVNETIGAEEGGNDEGEGPAGGLPFSPGTFI